MLLIDQGRIGASTGPGFDAALRTELDLGDQRAAALTRLWLGELSLQRGDTVAARGMMSQAAADLGRSGDPVAAAAAMGQQGALEAAAGLPAKAESLYRAALRRVRARVPRRRSPGSCTRGLPAFAAIAARVTRPRASIAPESPRSRRLAGRWRSPNAARDSSPTCWDVYVQLALLESKRGHVVAAFDVSERARASEMLEMLSQGRRDPLRPTPLPRW